MRTGSIQSHTAFGNYYRVPNSPENFRIINDLMLPNAQLANFPIQVAKGETPIAHIVMGQFTKFSESNRASLNWLKNHAKMHNVDIPIDNFDTLTIVTGHKDCLEFLNFSLKSTKESAKNIIKTGIKRIFGFKSKEYKKGEPYYLEDLRMYADEYNKSKNQFYNYLSGKKVKKFDNVADVIQDLAK